MEAFNMLQAASWGGKETTNFNTLPIGEYPVVSFSLVDGLYGRVLKADLGDKFIFLPQRFAEKHTEETVAALNTLPHIMVLDGFIPGRRNNDM